MIASLWKANTGAVQGRKDPAAPDGSPGSKSRNSSLPVFTRKGRWYRVAVPLFMLLGPPAQAAPVEVRAALESAADVTLAVPGKVIRFSDGTRQAEARPCYRQTVVVQGPGSPSENGTALLSAVAAVTGASAGAPWLLKIEPGVYDLGTGRLQMKAHLDIEGAGETVTRITGTIDHPTQGVVCGASDSELRLLTVENKGGGMNAIAVSNLGASGRMFRVTARAAGGSVTNAGLFNDQGGEPAIRQVVATATGGSTAYGMYSRSTDVILEEVEATATGAFSNYAVSNGSCSPVMTGVTATASGGSYNYGVYNNDAAPRMTRVKAAATGGTMAYGVFNYNGSSPDIRDLTAFASMASSSNIAVETRESSAVMRWVRAEATGPGASYAIANSDATSVALFHVNASASGGNYNYGVHNNGSPLSMFAVTATATTTDAYALFLLGEGYGVSADACVFSGDSRSVYKVAGVTLAMGACMLDGPINHEAGQFACVECFDETATALNDDCRPPP